MSTADDETGIRRNVVVISSDSDDDAPIAAASSGKKGKKPSRPVVISSDDDDDDDEEVDCAAIAAAEAEGRDQLAASLGALSVDEKKKEKSEAAAPSASPPLPPVAFGEILLDGAIASQLYPHQKEGVAWMSSLAIGVVPAFRGGVGGAAAAAAPSSSSSSPPARFHGGILADEMGLGKTRQVAAFLRGAVDSGVVRRALVVAPKSLLRVWAEELAVVGVEAREFASGSPADRAAALAAVGAPRGSGVLLTTYGMLLHNGDELKRGGSAGGAKGSNKKQQQQGGEEEAASASVGNDGPSSSIWDAVVFDEGHCLKNPKTKIAELARSLDSKMKILLSGTPVQNDLDELFALFDLVAPGLLAADAKRFKSEFSTRIVAGSSRSASEGEKAAAAGAAQALRERMAPCFLRREKAAVLGVASSSSVSSSAVAASPSSSSSSATPAALGRKTDLVVWLRLTPAQRDVYRAFLKSDAVAAALNRTRSPLAAVTVLKKICDHPGLLTRRAAAAAAGSKVDVGDDESDEEEEEEEEEEFDSDDDFIDDGDDDDDGEYKPKPKPARTPSPAASGKGKGKKSGSSKGDEAAASSTTTPPPAAPPPLDPAALALEERLLALIAERGPAASCKTAFAPKLVRKLVAEGHRVLVFSQSRVMLDIVGAALEKNHRKTLTSSADASADSAAADAAADASAEPPLPFLRIDGTITSAAARQAIVAEFQRGGAASEPGGPSSSPSPSSSLPSPSSPPPAPPPPPVLLLTTGVGALGLTLTAATRVVLVEPGWNPSADSQAVDRAYRIGQARDVVVYRLVCAATVEEKVLRKQIFKQSLAKSGTRSGIPFRYFSQQELGDLFRLDEAALDAPPETAQAMLAALMQGGAPRDDEADAVVAREAAALAEVDRDCGGAAGQPSPPPSLFAGVSDHGRLYSVAGAGRVGEHRPPSPERERRSNNGGGGSTATSWPPGATPRPPAGRGRGGSPAAGRGGRGRGGGASSSPGGYGGGGAGGRRRRPQKPEDVAAGFLADVLGKAIGWGFNKIFSPKQQQQQFQQQEQAPPPPPPPPSSGAWPPPSFSAQAPPQNQQPPAAPQTEQELVSTIQRMDALLSDPTLRLPDGGAAARRKRDAAAEALEALRRSSGGGGSGGGGGNSAPNNAGPFAPLQQHHQQQQQQQMPTAGAAPSWGAAAAPADAFRQ